MATGKVLITIGIRDKAGARIGTLYAGDIVIGTVSGSNFYLTSVTRAGVTTAWPAGSYAKAQDGATVIIEIIGDVPPPPAPEPDYINAYYPDGTVKKYVPQ